MKRGDYLKSNAFNNENRLKDVEKEKASLNNQDVSIGQQSLEVPIEDQAMLPHPPAPEGANQHGEMQ